MKKIKILLVDDHKIIRDGITMILEFTGEYEVIGVSTAKSALYEIAANRIDLILTDIRMPEMSGISLCKEILSQRPDAKVMVLTMARDCGVIQECLEMGVLGFAFKDSGHEELLSGIQSVLDGEHFLSKEAAVELTLNHTRKNELNIQLTVREQEILDLISQEYTNKEIAEQLFVSIRTVDSHRRNLIDKIGAKNTAGLVRFALENKRMWA